MTWAGDDPEKLYPLAMKGHRKALHSTVNRGNEGGSAPCRLEEPG